MLAQGLITLQRIPRFACCAKASPRDYFESFVLNLPFSLLFSGTNNANTNLGIGNSELKGTEIPGRTTLNTSHEGTCHGKSQTLEVDSTFYYLAALNGACMPLFTEGLCITFSQSSLLYYLPHSSALPRLPAASSRSHRLQLPLPSARMKSGQNSRTLQSFCKARTNP